jgi:hypothetical protein
MKSVDRFIESKAKPSGAVILLCLSGAFLFAMPIMTAAPIQLKAPTYVGGVVLVAWALLLWKRRSQFDAHRRIVLRLFDPWGIFHFRYPISEFSEVHRVLRVEGEKPSVYYVDVVLTRERGISPFVFGSFGHFDNVNDALSNEPSRTLGEALSKLTSLPFAEIGFANHVA